MNQPRFHYLNPLPKCDSWSRKLTPNFRTPLDVVADVTGVDTLYNEYVDEWNRDVPVNGDNAIDKYVGELNAEAYKATAAYEAFETMVARAVDF